MTWLFESEVRNTPVTIEPVGNCMRIPPRPLCAPGYGSVPRSDAVNVSVGLVVILPSGVSIVTVPPGPLTWTPRETRYPTYPMAPRPSKPSPTTMATTIRMILTALPPVLAGAPIGWKAVGWGTATAGAPQDLQNCSPVDNAAPHFAQKLATMISLSLSFRPESRGPLTPPGR